MEREQFIALLIKKINNEISEPEIRLVEEAIAKNAEYAQIAAGILQYNSLPDIKPDYIQSKLADAWETIDNYKVTLLVKKNRFAFFLKVAAIIVLIAGAGIWFLTRTAKPPETLLSEMDTIQSGKERLYTTLEDGTQITLNKNSSIILNKNFGKNQRHIILKGEAFFDVTKNENNRLLIEADNINIEVKGTAFNVKTSETRKITEVALVRGLIEISNKYNKQNKVLLNPNQILSAPVNTQPELAFNISTLDTIPEKSLPLLSLDTLIFRKEKLKDLSKQLEKKYSVVIQIKNDLLKDKRFSGTFSVETIDEALMALKLSFPFRSKRIKNEIIIE